MGSHANMWLVETVWPNQAVGNSNTIPRVSNHRIPKTRRQNLDLICSLAHAKPQLPENFMSKDWASSRSPMARSKFRKFWLNFALGALLVHFVGPAGGDPTWRLETPPCGRERCTWLVETVQPNRPSVTAILFPGHAKSQFHMAINYSENLEGFS